jgi:hypothetical protein
VSRRSRKAIMGTLSEVTWDQFSHGYACKDHRSSEPINCQLRPYDLGARHQCYVCFGCFRSRRSSSRPRIRRHILVLGLSSMWHLTSKLQLEISLVAPDLCRLFFCVHLSISHGHAVSWELYHSASPGTTFLAYKGGPKRGLNRIRKPPAS